MDITVLGNTNYIPSFRGSGISTYINFKKIIQVSLNCETGRYIQGLSQSEAAIRICLSDKF